MPALANAAALVLDLPLRPYELLAAWRPDSRSLAIVVHEPVEAGQQVQARISVLGLGVGATIIGRAVRVEPAALGAHVELEPDQLRVRALERLVDLAAGARVVYRLRTAPRFLAQVPALVYRDRHAWRMTTFSVSENGCGLAWSGPTPAIGTGVDVHLGDGSEVASFFGEVRWTAPTGHAPAAGLQFSSGDRATWTRMLAELQRSGAPPA